MKPVNNKIADFTHIVYWQFQDSVWNQVDDSVGHQVSDQISNQVYGHHRLVYGQVNDQVIVTNQVWLQVGKQP